MGAFLACVSVTFSVANRRGLTAKLQTFKLQQMVEVTFEFEMIIDSQSDSGSFILEVVLQLILISNLFKIVSVI